MIYLLGVVITLMTIGTDLAVGQSVCGNPPVIWRNDNITCPARAVCADVFSTRRDWYNGTQCDENRVLSNCICAGNQVCPYENSSHLLYASATQRTYICEPRCTLPWCDNIRQQLDGVGRPTRRGVVAVTTEQRAQEFGGKTYYKMSCRCPRHHFPVMSRGGRSRAVKAYRYRYNYSLRRYSTEYICNTGSRDEPREDPCN